jgi:hypothetical protein
MKRNNQNLTINLNRCIITSMKTLISAIFFSLWIVGIVLAKGFWSTFFAVVFPFWGYYLVAEQLVTKYLL